MRPEAVTDKLGDRELLRNYCGFASRHRAVVGVTLFRALGADELQRRSIALEIFGNYVAALEDNALWFHVLRQWKEGLLLFDLLDKIEIRETEGHRYSSEAAIDELSAWTIADLRREFCLPTDGSLLSMGWTEARIKEYITLLRDALETMKSALEARTENERVLVSSYNKIKHGALAVAASEYSEIGVSVMLPSRKGPLDDVSGKRKINTAWILCEDEELRSIVRNTVSISSAMSAILNLIYMSRFDPEWRLPSLPVILAEWMGEAPQG